MNEAEFCESLRRRALMVLDAARAKLAIHPDNTTGMMAPHVAVESIARAAEVTKVLEAIALAGRRP